MGKTIKSKITMQTVISLVLAILVCELLSVSTLQNNMTTQARNFVEAQAGTNASVVNEWLVEEGNIVHTIRNGVAFMNTKDTDQIMDYLEVNLAENADALMYYVCFAYDGGVFPADHSKLDLDPTTRDWWKMAIAKDGLIYTAPYKDFASGQMIVTIAEPMKIQGEQAVFLADITIDTLTQIVGDVSTEDSIQAFLLDADGNVVIDEATGKPKKDPKTQTPYIVLDDINEINALPDGVEKERRLASIAPIKQMQIPMPDFVLCCNNICNCMTKWYENIARMHNIPLVMIDIPYNNHVTVDDTYVAYIRGQFDDAIKQLEKISGRKFDEKKFEQACANANRTAKAWLKVCDYLQYKPAPYSGFDLFNHMADVVTARGKVAAAEAFEQLAADLEEAVKTGHSTTPFPEKYRVMFEGIPCWPKLPALFKPLKANGVNVTAVVYAPAFGFVYNGMDEMVRAYCKAPNSVCIEQGVDWREGICRDNKVDGVLVHYNRSCKPWSGYMAEMQRRFTKDLGIPTAGFDGDQADPRNFNAAQYETRVQGLVEAMQANQKAKEEQ